MVKVTVLCSLLTAAGVLAADSTTTAAQAINSLGVDLLARVVKPDQNALISPYSLQSALAMTYAGADGKTREEMAKALHYPSDEAELHRSFAGLRKELNELVQRSAAHAEQMKRELEKLGRRSSVDVTKMKNDPITLIEANRLFGQTGYAFRTPFLSLVKDSYSAPFETVDFKNDAGGATKRVNDWVEVQTRSRIHNLIPSGALNDLTRLVLVNAIYLKAPWAETFTGSSTEAREFNLAAGAVVNVPTMKQQHAFGYAKANGFTALVLPYVGEEIHFLILLPDKSNSLSALEAKLNAKLLAEVANLGKEEMILYLPKFKVEPNTLELSTHLGTLGMKTAFDEPIGSANFDRIAPRRLPNDYLYIKRIFHKTFLILDEDGTEAAASNAIAFLRRSGIPQVKVEVHVDRPFLFAIQHQPSGACLFLGRVVDPR